MLPMTPAGIARVCGGTVHGDPDVTVTGEPYLDSRSPVPGGLFVALAGARTDGHRHAAGAHAVLGTRPAGPPTVVVADPVVALARLARHVLDRIGPQVLAVTGSAGKTGCKELLAALLPDAVATAGNLNNELGVPLTALRVTPGTRRLVLETGARGVGQLSWLSGIARPSIAAVLNAGTAHLGAFGSRDLVARAKGELVALLPPEGVAVLNADDPRVAAMAGRTRARVLTFGRSGEVSWRGLRLDADARPTFELGHAGDWVRVRLGRLGAHQVPAAAAAAAMALAAGESLRDIGSRMQDAAPVPRRMQPRRRADGLLVIDDSYNASPDAVRAALGTLDRVGRARGGRRVAVLGEMRELGPAAPAAHRGTGGWARVLDVEVVAVGPAAAGIAAAAGGTAVPSREAALRLLRRELGPRDTVLVKGSRAAGLDLLADELVAAQPAARGIRRNATPANASPTSSTMPDSISWNGQYRLAGW